MSHAVHFYRIKLSFFTGRIIYSLVALGWSVDSRTASTASVADPAAAHADRFVFEL